MNEQVTLELRYRNTGSELCKKSISNVNPNASDLVLKNFGIQLNSLTQNTLLNTIRIESRDITSVTE